MAKGMDPTSFNNSSNGMSLNEQMIRLQQMQQRSEDRSPSLDVQNQQMLNNKYQQQLQHLQMINDPVYI